MPIFTYRAVDTYGSEKAGQLTGSDIRHVGILLRQKGLFPIDVTPAGPAVVSARGAGLKWELRLPFTRVASAKELTLFTRQLATLLRAGMPLLRGLELLTRQERNPAFRRALGEMGAAIKSGGTLSAAMAAHPRVFDRLYLNMVRAGEAGGMLDGVLDRLAKFQEKSLQLRGKIKSALAYPIIVLLVAVGILVGLLLFVVPKFRQIFADLLKGAPLPPLTQLVLTVSDAVKTHYALALALGSAGWIGFKLFHRTPRGARLFDTWIIRLPLFGELILKAIIARFSRTLGTLLAGGVPILPALLITRDTCANARVAAAVTTVHDRVKEGATVARPLEAMRIFPPMVTGMIEVGEHTGQLPGMLGKVADIYEEEVDHAVAGLSSLIEPLLILFLALVVGTIVIALFLPIVRIVQLMT
jgi:type IV pilus assembly protein PilC